LPAFRRSFADSKSVSNVIPELGLVFIMIAEVRHIEADPRLQALLVGR